MLKQHIATGISLLLALLAYGQESKSEPKEARTKLEAFQAKTGAVIIKGIGEVGQITGRGALGVGCREFTDATTGVKAYGVVIEVKGGDKYDRAETTYIDYDEIDSLLKGIDYITKLDKKVTALPAFEAVYKTKGDLSVITFSSSVSANIQAAVQSGRFAGATVFLSLDQLAKFRGLVEEAKKKLDAIRKDG